MPPTTPKPADSSSHDEATPNSKMAIPKLFNDYPPRSGSKLEQTNATAVMTSVQPPLFPSTLFNFQAQDSIEFLRVGNAILNTNLSTVRQSVAQADREKAVLAQNMRRLEKQVDENEAQRAKAVADMEDYKQRWSAAVSDSVKERKQMKNLEHHHDLLQTENTKNKTRAESAERKFRSQTHQVKNLSRIRKGHEDAVKEVKDAAREKEDALLRRIEELEARHAQETVHLGDEADGDKSTVQDQAEEARREAGRQWTQAVEGLENDLENLRQSVEKKEQIISEANDVNRVFEKENQGLEEERRSMRALIQKLQASNGLQAEQPLDATDSGAENDTPQATITDQIKDDDLESSVTDAENEATATVGGAALPPPQLAVEAEIPAVAPALWYTALKNRPVLILLLGIIIACGWMIYQGATANQEWITSVAVNDSAEHFGDDILRKAALWWGQKLLQRTIGKVTLTKVSNGLLQPTAAITGPIPMPGSVPGG